MACDGALPDKATVKEVLGWYRLDGCRILVDMGFHFEDVLGILHQKGRTFVTPCPPNAVIRKAALLDLSHAGEFAYERNERGRKVEDRWQEHQDEAARQEGKKRAGRAGRSAFPGDRVNVLRDEALHDRLVADYETQIDRARGHAEEKLEELRPTFGVIAPRPTSRIPHRQMAPPARRRTTWRSRQA